jgi:hypothetical protein
MPQEGVLLEVTPGVRFVSTDAVTADMQPQDPIYDRHTCEQNAHYGIAGMN